MKKVVSKGIGGYSFQMEEDACRILQDYIEQFKAKLGEAEDVSEIMDDIEARIAEIIREEISSPNQVVGEGLIRQVVARMGMPDGSNDFTEYHVPYTSKKRGASRRLFRNPDDRKIGGVCGGLGAYLGVDATLLRILFLLGLIMGFLTFWIYIILWICVQDARTPAQKLQMQGLPVTAENLLRYSAKQSEK
ncbi:MAG: PspC domain-containing protein [Bacteroidales bacterium]|jgi:phage shock protein PspC (stress-responsive transcriptional regulator)|nr:PspC domain-containing protein [Bacteroidales bacterium]MDD2617345.1 PspC domain-containing protein [Bacteroidales bacterium]MDD4640232.1 PspC domain-containing protein [Bacteroidales bacterium]NLB02349.1 PspC domain-containing protein [Bacteroidales bacterium]